MSIYKNGELLARWREEEWADLLRKSRKARVAGLGCQSTKDGNPSDYAQSLLAMADAYERAAEIFTEKGTP